MMRLLILGLLAAICGGALILLISRDSGYVLVSIGSYTLEMSFWFAVACLCVFFLVLRVCKRLFARVYDVLAGSVSWLSESRAKKIEKRTTRGLLNFIEGNWRAAKKELLSAARLSDYPLVQYLAAARSAFALGDKDETKFLLQQAEKIAPENELAILLTQAQMEFSDNKYEQSLAILERAHKLRPAHPVVLDMLRKNYLYLQDWLALVELLPKLKNCKDYTKEHIGQLEEVVYTGYLAESGSDDLTTIWKSLPGSARKLVKVVEVYASRLNAGNQADKAIQVLATTLKSNWDESLVSLFGAIDASDKKEQLLIAESWLREHPGDSVLLLSLGKISKANKLWGKAKDYLNKSILIKPVPEAYAELASLLADLGEHKESVICYQKGLALRVNL